jgi:glycosyltransferase involved in cell wall biosynthesis
MIDSRRPRLLLLTVGLGVGGAEEIVRQSLPLIRKEGFDVTLGSLKGEGRLSGEIRESGIRVVSLGGSGPWDPVPLGRLWSWIRKERFDVIHSHLYWANLAARLAGRGAGTTVIINSHHGTDAWLSPYRRWMEKATAALADRVVTCSEAVRLCAVGDVGLPEWKVVTVTNGIRVERFSDGSRREAIRASLGLAEDRRVLGTVGRLDEPVKGLAVLVQAMESVVKRIPETVCLLIGDGPARGSLERAVERRGLAGHFRFLGERRDVPDLLHALDLYVQPSLLEGFGLSVLEAMAAGKAVVASRVGGIPEVVRDSITGDLVPPGDPNALAAGILALLEDRVRRERYGREGLLRARNSFPLEKMVRGWTDLYRDLLARKGRKEAA